MKKIYNYILLTVWALASVCCSEEELVQNQPTGKPGDEVQFGLSLGNGSRTIYGNKTNNAFPIYWVDGDKVQIYSPECLSGRNNAEYKVSVAKTNQNYADGLTKTGSYGLQWGSETANFYSLYPSGQYTLSDDGTKIQNVMINYNQDIYVADDTDGNPIVTPKMTDCLMYAMAKEQEVGKTVNLTYSPIATAIMLTLNSDKSSVVDNFTIQAVRLTAPENTYVAGSFSLELTTGDFSDWMPNSTPSRVITLQLTNKSTGAFYKLAKGKSITLPIFVAPQDDIAIDGWKIEVVTDQGTFVKELSGTSKEFTLKPGMVHEMNMPNLIIRKAKEWNPADWMKDIPRNVYLSEVSIPGSWNSLNKDFQGTSPSISTQYSNGVRAFHLDCRWTTTLKAGGALFADDFYKVGDLNSNNMYLSVCDGGKGRHVRTGSSAVSSSLGQIMDQNNTSFSEYLAQVTENVQPNEYMIVFCSFAQDSYNDPSKTGKTWFEAISEVCASNDKVYDASNLTSNTLVGDVLNSVIVIVNCDDNIDNIELPEDSRCLFVHIPNNLTSDYFPTTDGGFKTDLLHSTGGNLDITLAVSQAQISSSSETTSYPKGVRGYYPSLGERDRIVNNILNWSKTNYGTEEYKHDKWIYLGLGGSTASSASSKGDDGTSGTIASRYSTLINNRLTQMDNGTTKYYPVGIVYLNNTTTTPSSGTVINILKLNSKYRLQFNPQYPSDYDPLYYQPGSGDTEGSEGGDA